MKIQIEISFTELSDMLMDYFKKQKIDIGRIDNFEMVNNMTRVQTQKRLCVTVVRLHKPESEKGETNFILAKSIDGIDVSPRVYNILKVLNIKTLGDLIKNTKKDLLKCRNFGIKSLSKLEALLKSHNLSFAEE